jgi:hypothetical protein
MGRKRKLVDHIRQTAYENRNGVFIPRAAGDHRTNWPVCQTCHRDVEAVEMVDFNGKSVTVRAKCHGAEDHYTVELPFRIGGWNLEDETVNDHVRMCMRGNFFDPTVPSK